MAENPGSKKLVIAIDGVVGAGKSATARGAAQTLGYRHLDTGSMYRAFALAATRRDIQPNQSEALAQLLDELRLMLELERGVCRVYLDGEDVTEPIRDPAVSRRVGDYADVPLVRHSLVQRQRQGHDSQHGGGPGQVVGIPRPGHHLHVHGGERRDRAGPEPSVVPEAKGLEGCAAQAQKARFATCLDGRRCRLSSFLSEFDQVLP